MSDAARFSLRDKLVPGSHDSLIEVLGKYPRQAGNQVVLAISEACLEIWPLTEADFNVPPDGEHQLIKMTLHADKYPKLHALYRTLPKGVKGAVIINLLNRHQLARQISPELVTDALNADLARKSGSFANVTGRATADIKKDGGLKDGQPAVGADRAVQKSPVIASEPDIEIGLKAAEPAEVASGGSMMFDDPLASLPPMEFT